MLAYTHLLATVFALGQVGLALAATTVTEYKEWKSIGCQGDSTSARALNTPCRRGVSQRYSPELSRLVRRGGVYTRRPLSWRRVLLRQCSPLRIWRIRSMQYALLRKHLRILRGTQCA
ncbi:hypothetical protein B0H14DRAFT_2614382 [Mycena olivaceomarginata]|nr:hypothetical protein B0H14DRAFT_2614382 [Mycena olivaceomarginata]